MSLHFYELKKLPPLAKNDKHSGKDLWLKLFRAETEEDLREIDALEVSDMSEVLQAYRHVATSGEFKERERLWAKARHDEAQALSNARQQEREHWQGVMATMVASKDTALAEKDELIAQLQAQLAKNN
jgi:hypothetical protein